MRTTRNLRSESLTEDEEKLVSSKPIYSGDNKLIGEIERGEIDNRISEIETQHSTDAEEFRNGISENSGRISEIETQHSTDAEEFRNEISENRININSSKSRIDYLNGVLLDNLTNPGITPIIKTLDFREIVYAEDCIEIRSLFSPSEWSMVERGEACLDIDFKAQLASTTDDPSREIGFVAHGHLNEKEVYRMGQILQSSEASVSLTLMGTTYVSGESNTRGSMINSSFIPVDYSKTYYDDLGETVGRTENMTIGMRKPVFYGDNGEIQVKDLQIGSITFTLTPCSVLAGYSWGEIKALMSSGHILPLGATKSVIIDGNHYLFKLVDNYSVVDESSFVPQKVSYFVWMAEEPISFISGDYINHRNHYPGTDPQITISGFTTTYDENNPLVQLFMKTETGLKNLIASVNPPVYNVDKTSLLKPISKFFLPSATELYGDSAMDIFDNRTEGHQFQLFELEGISYDNYFGLRRRDSYWIRTLDSVSKWGFIIGYFGQTPDRPYLDPKLLSNQNGIVPCFCITDKIR